jgi:hypothetical protein
MNGWASEQWTYIFNKIIIYGWVKRQAVYDKNKRASKSRKKEMKKNNREPLGN